MVEFFQSYGAWIVLGLLFLLMLRSHAHGSGGCGGSHQHDEADSEKKEGQQEFGKQSPGCH